MLLTHPNIYCTAVSQPQACGRFDMTTGWRRSLTVSGQSGHFHHLPHTDQVLITKTGIQGVKFQKHNEYLLCNSEDKVDDGIHKKNGNMH